MIIDSLFPGLAQISIDAVVIVDGHADPVKGRCITWCNEAALRDTGYSLEALVGATPDVLFGPATSAPARQALQDGFAARKSFRVSMVLYRQNGSDYWSEWGLTPLMDDDGDLAYWLIFVRDVSDKMALLEQFEVAEATARHAQQRLWSAIEALPEGFSLYDSEDRLVLFNEPYRASYEAYGAVLRVGETFENLMWEALQRGQFPAAVGREEAWMEERMEMHRDPQAPQIIPLPGNRFFKLYEYKTPAGDTVTLRSDVTVIVRQGQKLREQAQAIKNTLEELEHVSRTDRLTGLGNRRGLDLKLEEIQASIDPRFKVAIVHIDLDRFKPINDVFGHAAGDYVLRAVACILRACIRANDYVARIGGDEFALVLTENGEVDLEVVAENVAKRIIGSCSKSLKWKENNLLFGASVGVATGHVHELDRLMQDADIALYEAKAKGRNRSARFTPELRNRVESRKILADKFLYGLENGEVVAHYQPQVDATTGRMVGAEALVRWEHPGDGLINPSEFLPIAEDLGLLAEVDDLVLRHALNTATRCKSAGVPLPKVSVNISYSRIKKLTDLSALKELQPWPCVLSFELLEAIDFDEQDSEFAWTLDSLRNMGIKIEIDDFGSGRASLTTLLNIRPDRIKIDRRIVSEALSEDAGAGAMVRAISEMARGLGIAMTAEGIETQQQSAHMRDMGCDVLQGFLYSAALRCDDLIAWMRSQKHSAQLQAEGI